MLRHLVFGFEAALAWFGLLNLCAAGCFLAIAPLARRSAALSRLPALALRLMPAGISVGAVLGLVIPAFVWLEPGPFGRAPEQLGFFGGMLALIGAGVLLLAFARGLRAVARTRRAMRPITDGALDTGLKPAGVRVMVSDSPDPVMVLCGSVRPRLYVTQSVQDSLTQEEFERALAHELAHHAARDNAKRRLLAFAPDAVSGSSLARELELRWQHEAELAADAVAAGGDEGGAMALASALIKVARLRAGQPPADLGQAAFHDGRPIGERVRRLLAHGVAPAPDRRRARATSIILLAVASALVAMAPTVLESVHRLTEFLVHLP